MREAFPNTVGGLYVREEMDHVHDVAELTEVMEPQRIETVQAEAEVEVASVVDVPEKKPAAVDWKAELERYGVMEQGTLLRDCPTQADRDCVMTASHAMVGGSINQNAYDCLCRYDSELATREGVAV